MMPFLRTVWSKLRGALSYIVGVLCSQWIGIVGTLIAACALYRDEVRPTPQSPPPAPARLVASGSIDFTAGLVWTEKGDKLISLAGDEEKQKLRKIYAQQFLSTPMGDLFVEQKMIDANVVSKAKLEFATAFNGIAETNLAFTIEVRAENRTARPTTIVKARGVFKTIKGESLPLSIPAIVDAKVDAFSVVKLGENGQLIVGVPVIWIWHLIFAEIFSEDSTAKESVDLMLKHVQFGYPIIDLDKPMKLELEDIEGTLTECEVSLSSLPTMLKKFMLPEPAPEPLKKESL